MLVSLDSLYRNEWLRGVEPPYVMLRADDNKKTCLGFYLLALGISEDSLVGRKTPIDIVGEYPHDGRWLMDNVGCSFYPRGGKNSPDCNYLMMANNRWFPEWDGKPYTEQKREERIVEIFEKHGVEVEFIN